MRCPDCGKFVAYGERDPECSGEDVSGDILTIDVNVVLECADCSGDLKGSEMTLEIDLSEFHECDDETLEQYRKENDIETDVDELIGADRWEPEPAEASFTSRTQTHDRNGKPIKNARYAKTYYGAEVTCQVTCNRCGEQFEVTGSCEEAASSFEELV